MRSGLNVARAASSLWERLGSALRRERSGDAIDLAELKEQTDIADVAALYVPSLRRVGREWKGLCPFHQEKTPSFYVIPRQGRYYCFGCRASGDAIRLVQELEKVTFVEAADRLAARLGRRFYGRETPEERGLKELILAANAEAARYYADILAHSERAAEARAYVSARGIAPATVEAFEIGYSLPEWEALRGFLIGRGHRENTLREAGLLKEREGASGSYDRFRGRLMFPIRSPHGEVVAFGGRALGDDEPKYLNSPASPVFDKSRTLYGLHRASEGMRAQGVALVVEGYTDVIACHQAGINNAVATLGTALTRDHLVLLRRHAERAVIAYDADSAGLSAVLRSAADLLDSGLEVTVVVLEPGEDPDSLLRRRGVEALRRVVEGAQPLYHFVLDRLLPEPGASYERSRLEGAIQALARLRSETDREQYIAYASDRLCLGDRGRMASMAAALRREVRALARRERARRPATQAGDESFTTETIAEGAVAQVPLGVLRAEQAVLAAIAQEKASPEEVFGRLGAEHFRDGVNRELAERIQELLRTRGDLTGPGFFDGLSEPAAQRWSALSLGESHTPSGPESLAGYLESILLYPKRERLRELERTVPALLGRRERTEEDVEAIREYQELRRYFSEQTGHDTVGF